jgi:hypothetical protein
MKKNTVIIASNLFAISLFAQIPNSGFETWISKGAYSIPDQWGTMNNTTTLASVYTAEKGAPGNPGTSYLKLTSKTTPAGVANGIAVSGKLDSITMLPKSGFAYSQQPAKFTGSWQHMISGSSQGSVSATLTKWNSTTKQREVIATSTQTLSGMAMSWANFDIPFSYSSTNIPDSCIILLKASGATPVNGDYLWVDNLAFSGTVTSIEKQASTFADLNVYTNSINESIQIDFQLTSSQNVKIQLLDLNGKQIKEISLGSISGYTRYTINSNGIAKGVYFVNLISKEESELKKIIIK